MRDTLVNLLNGLLGAGIGAGIGAGMLLLLFRHWLCQFRDLKKEVHQDLKSRLNRLEDNQGDVATHADIAKLSDTFAHHVECDKSQTFDAQLKIIISQGADANRRLQALGEETCRQGQAITETRAYLENVNCALQSHKQDAAAHGVEDVKLNMRDHKTDPHAHGGAGAR